MTRPPLVVPALLVLVSAAGAGRLPSTLRLEQLERTQLDAPRLERPRLEEPRLEEPRLEGPRLERPRLEEPRLEEPRLEQPQLERPRLLEPRLEAERQEQEPRRPWPADRRSRHREEDAERQQGGRGERLQHSRHRKRKRPSAQHLLFLRSRDSTCPRSPSGEEQIFCASHHPSGERACVSLPSLCDGVPDCPEAEDELAVGCLFYNAVSRNLQKMTDKVLQLTAHHRSRLR